MTQCAASRGSSKRALKLLLPRLQAPPAPPHEGAAAGNGGPSDVAAGQVAADGHATAAPLAVVLAARLDMATTLKAQEIRMRYGVKPAQLALLRKARVFLRISLLCVLVVCLWWSRRVGGADDGAVSQALIRIHIGAPGSCSLQRHRCPARRFWTSPAVCAMPSWTCCTSCASCSARPGRWRSQGPAAKRPRAPVQYNHGGMHPMDLEVETYEIDEVEHEYFFDLSSSTDDEDDVMFYGPLHSFG